MLNRKMGIIKEITLIILFIILVSSNIYLICRNYKSKEQVIVNEENIYEKIDEEYNEDKKYYKIINYKTFKRYFEGESLKTIAVIDNSSKTYEKFLETINKIAFYNRVNIYLLETSKLTKKNEISFYEIDERLALLKSDYLITVMDEKILSLTSFDNVNLNLIEKGIGE